jgi:uncharacterized damage-inducible protein DinB
MDKNDICTLFEYNYWANDRILNAAARVTPEQFVGRAEQSHGSLRGTLVHTFGAEVVWRLRCQEGISPVALPAEGDFPTLEALWTRWKAEELAMRSFLDSLGDADLERIIQYRNTKGVPFENIMWHLLAHLVNHGTQSRAEAGLVLTAYDQSPGDLDMILFFREKGEL